MILRNCENSQNSANEIDANLLLDVPSLAVHTVERKSSKIVNSIIFENCGIVMSHMTSVDHVIWSSILFVQCISTCVMVIPHRINITRVMSYLIFTFIILG